MNLRRQLLIVSLLTLVLPWAGCQFIHETETALREGQRNMLDRTAQAIADSLSQFPAEFLDSGTDGTYRDQQIYAHPLGAAPLLDGYLDDWGLATQSMRSMRGAEGAIVYAAGNFGQSIYVVVEVRDSNVIYATPNLEAAADQVELTSVHAGGQREHIFFVPEASGALIGRRETGEGTQADSRLQGHWLETAFGYRLELRMPRRLVGSYLGLTVVNAGSGAAPTVRSSSFDGGQPGRFVTISPVLSTVASQYAQDDLRLIVTDRAGWRLASVGRISGSSGSSGSDTEGAGWMRLAYNAVLEPGSEAQLAELNPLGRERESYVVRALNGQSDGDWFRSAETGRTVVAVAKPVWSGSVQTGAVILQQGTDAILSLTNVALGRLLTLTLIATLVGAASLLGYASWLSLRIRRLASAAERAVDNEIPVADLPSAAARDEIGDLSRSFSDVLRQLQSYNEYLRTLASKLSHELRTPLTIVNSSLENLEHEALSDAGTRYTERARGGAQRLKKILDAMSEANRVEALMQNVDQESFDLRRAVESTVSAYADAWKDRRFAFAGDTSAPFAGSPELIVQLLDKLVDNAVGFSQPNDEIAINLRAEEREYVLSVFNPGPPLPDTMRSQLFDSMVSLRAGEGDKHLGLGLYVARIIAEGHGGKISAQNENNGVSFTVRLPRA